MTAAMLADEAGATTRGVAGGRLAFHDFPVGVLAGDPVPGELQQIAPAHREALPSVVVPVRSQVETPWFPDTQWRSSP
jgi:hypothetical protein